MKEKETIATHIILNPNKQEFFYFSKRCLQTSPVLVEAHKVWSTMAQALFASKAEHIQKSKPCIFQNCNICGKITTGGLIL